MDGNLNSFSNYKSDYFSQGASIQILIRISYLGYRTPVIHVGKEYVCIDLYILHIHGTSRDHDKSQTTNNGTDLTSWCFPEELVRDKGTSCAWSFLWGLDTHFVGWGTLLVGSGSDDLGWFWALEIGKGLVNSANTLGIYGIFTYISFVFDGKCRNLYNTWMVWDMVSVSGQIQPPNTSIQLQMIRHFGPVDPNLF